MFSVNWMKITVHLSFPGVQNAIANASTLAEVERLKGLLQSGQIPGRERRAGQEPRSDFLSRLMIHS